MAKPKKPSKPKPRVSAEEWVGAADDMLDGLERDVQRSRAEVAPLRLHLVAAAREAGQLALGGMKTARVGRTRILVPTPGNTKRVSVASERVKERFSRFSLQWLDKGQIKQKISEGWEKADQAEFFRHSNRLARNARMFLERTKELEPSLDEEVDATLAQLEDAKNDLLKLEVRSLTTTSENLLRNIGGRTTRETAKADIQTFDLDRNLWNLSLLEHPQGVVRELMANASKKMAARVTTKRSQIPLRSMVMAGAGPDAVSKMTPKSRTAEVLWRLFSAKELDDRFAKLNRERGTTSTWRGLGLGYNSPDWYIPVSPEIEDDVRRLMRERRADLIKGFEIKE